MAPLFQDKSNFYKPYLLTAVDGIYLNTREQKVSIAAPGTYHNTNIVLGLNNVFADKYRIFMGVLLNKYSLLDTQGQFQNDMNKVKMDVDYLVLTNFDKVYADAYVKPGKDAYARLAYAIIENNFLDLRPFGGYYQAVDRATTGVESTLKVIQEIRLLAEFDVIRQKLTESEVLLKFGSDQWAYLLGPTAYFDKNSASYRGGGIMHLSYQFHDFRRKHSSLPDYLADKTTHNFGFKLTIGYNSVEQARNLPLGNTFYTTINFIWYMGDFGKSS